MPLPLRLFAVAVMALFFSPLATAHEYYVAGFTLIHPWAEATAADTRDAPVYFTMEAVTAPDRLLRVRTPHAERVELRGGDDLAASALTVIDITASDTLAFLPGRPHLLLRGLKAPLQWGRSYEMTFEFEKAGPVQVMLSIGAH